MTWLIVVWFVWPECLAKYDVPCKAGDVGIKQRVALYSFVSEACEAAAKVGGEIWVDDNCEHKDGAFLTLCTSDRLGGPTHPKMKRLTCRKTTRTEWLLE